MHIRLFAKKYWVRRFGKQTVKRGFVTTGREDFVLSANIHPMGSDSQQALPEGERMQKHLEGHGDVELKAASQNSGEKGDLLLYHGQWYECTACQMWDHTALSHCNYQFAILPIDGAGTADTKNPPTEDPNEEKDEYTKYEVEIPVAGEDTVGGVKIQPGYGLVIDSEGYLSIDGATAEQVLDLFTEGGRRP